MKIKARQTGLTLIEIMIALLIGAFLLGGVLQIFVNSKQTYRMQENMSRLQENGQYAMGYLSRDIRMAGYWDCMMPSDSNNVTTAMPNPHYIDLEGVEGASGAPDSITLRAAFVRTKTDGCDALTDAGQKKICLDTYTCGTAVTTAVTVASPAAPTNFYADSSSKITYSINSNNLRRVTGPSSGANADIVEGIENMQIVYGVDTDADETANYYVAANTPATWVAADWAKVVSIRITITARTLDDNLTLKTTANPNGRITRDFTSTIALRNRLRYAETP